MAKDPAMLWYWNDWNSGTVTLSRFLKGCYIDLLHAQFNNGHLSMEEIKTVLAADFTAAWPTLQKKFETDPQGLFFNKRLEHEQLKRKSFSESRRVNRMSNHMSGHMSNHMTTHMENENRNENKDQNGSLNSDFDSLFLKAFDELTCERLQMTFKNIPDLGRELQMFRTKCDNDPDDYHKRDVAGLRNAFQYQLKNYRPNGKTAKTLQDTNADIERIVAAKYGTQGTK